MQVDLTDCLSSIHSFPSQSLPEKYRVCLIQMKTTWAVSSTESNCSSLLFFFSYLSPLEVKWQYFLFLRTTPYFIYVKGTSSSEKSKNRLIFFQLDVPWVAPLLGMNANVLDIFLCIFAVLRVPSIVYYVSAFLLSVWHPKQQHWLSECLEGC